MTLYKCDKCAEVWTKGPMRDAVIEGWMCPDCLRARIRELEAGIREYITDDEHDFVDGSPDGGYTPCRCSLCRLLDGRGE